mmetsp:Transcript_25647/g.37617  ORF Transcript_25647/g.37617 Transcript_25647/m.37617 type:complete len:275 (+) Transcript_25647:109-933(+)
MLPYAKFTIEIYPFLVIFASSTSVLLLIKFYHAFCVALTSSKKTMILNTPVLHQRKSNHPSRDFLCRHEEAKDVSYHREETRFSSPSIVQMAQWGPLPVLLLYLVVDSRSPRRRGLHRNRPCLHISLEEMQHRQGLYCMQNVPPALSEMHCFCQRYSYQVDSVDHQYGCHRQGGQIFHPFHHEHNYHHHSLLDQEQQRVPHHPHLQFRHDHIQSDLVLLGCKINLAHTSGLCVDTAVKKTQEDNEIGRPVSSFLLFSRHYYKRCSGNYLIPLQA